jgi:hypothetical protein
VQRIHLRSLVPILLCSLVPEHECISIAIAIAIAIAIVLGRLCPPDLVWLGQKIVHSASTPWHQVKLALLKKQGIGHNVPAKTFLPKSSCQKNPTETFLQIKLL